MTDAIHRVLSAGGKSSVHARSFQTQEGADVPRPRTYKVDHAPKYKPTLIICGAGIAGVSAAYFLSQQWNGEIYLICPSKVPTF